MTIKNYIRHISSPYFIVKEIQFANGLVMQSADVQALIAALNPGGGNLVAGTADADYLNATGANESLRGYAGNDTLRAGGGDDSLDGGLGNDNLRGDEGNDEYYFARGDGRDTVNNNDVLSATDTLRFGPGVADNEVLAFRTGNDMYLRIRGTADYLYFVNYYTADSTLNGLAADYKIDKVVFDNGVVWDQAMIETVVARAASNHSPVINSYLPTLKTRVGSNFSYTVAANTITDPDAWDSVIYSIEMSDDSAVPAWLHFDAKTRTLFGTPGTTDVGTLNLMLWGTDSYGKGTGEDVDLVVSPNRAPVLSSALADRALVQGVPFT